MDSLLIAKFNVLNKSERSYLLGGLVIVVLLIIVQDFLRANINDSDFYFSESFMFSTFWWFFIPFLVVQHRLVSYTRTEHSGLRWLAIALPFVVHLFAFPVLVWLLSKTFYDHTFTVQQTLTHTLAEHVYLLVIVYTTPAFVDRYYSSSASTERTPADVPPGTNTNHSIDTFLVSEGGRKRTIPIREIVYFSAVPPYIGIHTDEKKYLYTATLKSIAIQLPAQQFVRIHRSTIVNINWVEFYTSRLNGDYDLTLKNKAILRVSRNFAAEFKQRLQESHHLAAV